MQIGISEVSIWPGEIHLPAKFFVCHGHMPGLANENIRQAGHSHKGVVNRSKWYSTYTTLSGTKITTFAPSSTDPKENQHESKLVQDTNVLYIGIGPTLVNDICSLGLRCLGGSWITGEGMCTFCS